MFTDVSGQRIHPILTKAYNIDSGKNGMLQASLLSGKLQMSADMSVLSACSYRRVVMLSGKLQMSADHQGSADNIGARPGQLWADKSPNYNSDSARDASQRPHAQCDVISNTVSWYHMILIWTKPAHRRIVCCISSMMLHVVLLFENY